MGSGAFRFSPVTEPFAPGFGRGLFFLRVRRAGLFFQAGSESATPWMPWSHRCIVLLAGWSGPSLSVTYLKALSLLRALQVRKHYTFCPLRRRNSQRSFAFALPFRCLLFECFSTNLPGTARSGGLFEDP